MNIRSELSFFTPDWDVGRRLVGAGDVPWRRSYLAALAEGFVQGEGKAATTAELAGAAADPDLFLPS